MIQLAITLVGYIAVFSFGYNYSRRKLLKASIRIVEAAKSIIEDKSTCIQSTEFFYLCGLGDGVQILFGLKPERPNLSKVLTEIHSKGVKKNA